MRKGAVENMKSVAVRDLLGLRFRTPAELREMGLDVGKLERRAEFQDHAKDESGVPVIEWGKKRGTPLSALADRELDWYIEAAKKAIADPDKAQCSSRNTRCRRRPSASVLSSTRPSVAAASRNAVRAVASCSPSLAHSSSASAACSSTVRV